MEPWLEVVDPCDGDNAESCLCGERCTGRGLLFKKIFCPEEFLDSCFRGVVRSGGDLDLRSLCAECLVGEDSLGGGVVDKDGAAAGGSLDTTLNASGFIFLPAIPPNATLSTCLLGTSTCSLLCAGVQIGVLFCLLLLPAVLAMKNFSPTATVAFLALSSLTFCTCNLRFSATWASFNLISS